VQKSLSGRGLKGAVQPKDMDRFSNENEIPEGFEISVMDRSIGPDAPGLIFFAGFAKAVNRVAGLD